MSDENKKTSRSEMLANMPIPKLIRNLAMPAIIGFSITVIYNMVDTAFITRLGDAHSAASIIALPIYVVVSAIGLAIGIGSGSTISRLMGEKKTDMAQKVVTTGIITSALFGLFLSNVIPFFAEELLRAAGSNDSNLQYSLDYTVMLIRGSVFTMLNMTINNMLRGEGSAKNSMYALMTGAIVNTILDPIFIFDFGFGMGIYGAALATVISQGISTAILLSFYLRGKTELKFKLSNFAPSKMLYYEIFKIGIPTFFIQTLMSISMVFLNRAAGEYGNIAITSMGVSMRVVQLGSMIIIGYAQGYQPVAGYNFGSRNIERMKEAYYHTLKMTVGMGFLFSAVVMIFAEGIISLFNPDSEIVRMGSMTLRALYCMFPAYGFTMTNSYTFQAYGRARESFILSISRQGIILIPIAIILPKLLGYYGVMFSMPIADILSALLTFVLIGNVKKQYFQNSIEDEEKR